MSNFATFSEFYERIQAFRSQINHYEFLKLAAFDEALSHLKALCEQFAENDADAYPPYFLLTAIRSKFNVPFDIPSLDQEITSRLLPELERIIQFQQVALKAAVISRIEKLYSSFTDEKEQELKAFLKEAKERGFHCPLLFPLLRRLKADYFDPGCIFSDYAALFTRLCQQFGPTRFEYGNYAFTFTEGQYYQYYRSLQRTQPPPYSARDIGRELQVARERAEVLQSVTFSSSAPEIRVKKPY